MTLPEQIKAIFGIGENNHIVIMQKIRVPRSIAAIVVGASLGLAGLMMQTSLGNDMASPQTLGVTNAATFGANVAIIGFAGGFLATGNNIANYFASSNIFSTSLIAFVFAFFSILLILGLCKLTSVSKETIILAGVAITAIWTGLTSLLQYYATDVSLSAAVVWSFGDLGRANYNIDFLILVILILSSSFFFLYSNKYNAMLAGDDVAKTVGIKVESLRLITLLISSLITAICVANLGIIAFLGIICPHIAKRIFGQDHKHSIPATILIGSILLLFSDTLARLIGGGSSLPVGIITSIIGAPFFLYIIFRRKKAQNQ